MNTQERLSAEDGEKAFGKPEYTGDVMSGEIDPETGEVLTKDAAEKRKEERGTLH